MNPLLPSEISVVVPVHDVAEYLPEFLDSLEAQGSDRPADIVFIDDGSTDAGADLIDAWIKRHAASARLVRTENRGVSAARNSGLDEVTGEWVVFLDPDDVLAPGYFASLRGFIDAHPRVDLAATNLLRLQEPDRVLRDNHPLRFRFAGGDRVAELEDDVFIMNAASVAFPVEAVRRSGARFTTGLHASEDALFVAAYLLSLGRVPRAGFVAEARYGYRKRAARTSAVDRYRADPGTYTVRFAEGYAPLLEAAAAAGGVPSWLQSMLLYEMQWLLPVQMDPQRHAANLSESQRAETLAGIARCLRHVDSDQLLRYDATALPLECRLLILALTGRPLWGWVGAYARLPRRWRREADLIVYSTDHDAAESAARAWYPDYFGQRALRASALTVSPTCSVARSGSHGLTIIWPRPGETTTQAQDRHRRASLDETTLFIPPREHEVYVRRMRPWASGRAHRTVIHREQRRRSIWSKDAVLGALLRPGRTWLIELGPHEQPSDAFALRDALTRYGRVRIANARGGAPVADTLSFGSLAHRVMRARATAIVSAHPDDGPSPRARVRGLRALLLRDALTPSMIRAIRRFDPDLVLTDDDGTVSAVESTGIACRAMLSSNVEPATVARTLWQIRPARRKGNRHAA